MERDLFCVDEHDASFLVGFVVVCVCGCVCVLLCVCMYMCTFMFVCVFVICHCKKTKMLSFYRYAIHNAKVGFTLKKVRTHEGVIYLYAV